MNDPIGSRWRKWDLHFHTPKSGDDYGNTSLTPAQVVQRLLQAKVEVVVVTDHHILDPDFIREMRIASSEQLAVLPGIELTSNLGGSEGVHFVAIFSEESDLVHLSAELMAKLDLNAKRKNGIAETRLYVQFPDAAGVIQELGGRISIHGHGKSANFESITSRLQFKQQQKTDLLREYVDIIEVGSLKDATPYWETIFKSIGFTLPIVVCSDDHAKSPYPTDRCCWIKADPTFAGLVMALREPESRFCLDDIPPSVNRVKMNKTRYIKKVSFKKTDTMPAGEEWLQGEVVLNPGLVAIIGNKGSGKSALSDSIGLLGSCSTSDAFSFLSKERFYEVKTGRAQHIEATLHWEDGAPRTRILSETVAVDEPERVRYLPQSFVEKVCNELATLGGRTFESELKKVIFSKIPKARQLGKRTLDELIQCRTQEIRREADRLSTRLIPLAEERANLEERLDPTVKSALENRIAQIEEQIRSHEAGKPAEMKPPAEDPAMEQQSRTDLELLEELRKERDTIIGEISKSEANISAKQIRAAQANRLLEKLKNLEAEFLRGQAELAEDAEPLGLDAKSLAALTINRSPVETIRDEAVASIDAATTSLDGPLPDGLRAKSEHIDGQIRAVQERLTKPQQDYQDHLERLAGWQARLDELKGSEDVPDSLLGLQADFNALRDVPNRISGKEVELERIAGEIHNLRVAESEFYGELYEPVQKFVTEHPLAQDQLKIEFRVELIEERFVEDFLAHINQHRIGSFMGAEEGRALAAKLAASVEWANWSDVKAFLETLVERLHKRDGDDRQLQLQSQIIKGRTVAELYAWLFSLAYVKPRYILKSDGKRLEQLSPGERGSLLLVFYLLVDDSDLPLIIDQPEANLDNATVAKKLVNCIRHARDRRQVVIVTHNPNLAVVCDAEQIIHASLDIEAGHRVTYTSGALENPIINQFTIDVLEGGRPPFDKRDDTYSVMEH